MASREQLEKLITELGYTFELDTEAEGMLHYDIQLDASDETGISAMLYSVDGESFVRLLAYVDDVAEDNALDHLAHVLTLNADLPDGAFCMDPEEKVLYYTINFDADELSAEELGFNIDLLMACQDYYFLETYPDAEFEDDAAEG